MAELILCVGNTGTGKSTAIRNLDPKETFIFNVAQKPLPFPGYKKKYTPFKATGGESTGNMLNSKDPETIAKVLKHISSKRPEIKQIFIDDSGYIMGFSNMDKAEEKNFDKFTKMAKEFYDVISASISLRDDLKIVLIGHEENEGDALNPKRKYKTIGKLFDKAIGVEGLFTYVFFTDVKIDEDTGKPIYKFMTNTDGTTTAKTPMGCFKEMFIDNDWSLIFKYIDAYNNGEEIEEDKEEEQEG